MNREQFNSLLERKAVNASGETTSVKELPWRFLGLYFSATWCGACQSFGKQFSRFYHDLNRQKKDLEVLTVSLDSEREGYLEQVSSYPWWSLRMDMDYNSGLMHLFGIQFIPQLLVLDREGRTVSRSGINDIRQRGFNVLEYWQSLQNKPK